ncbi:transketolase [Trichonephila clavata]|uniref:transketolase n=1 Tax=Trichonephila clavata TaxID=2740835 RepID=A0A8X6LCN7_TRICU|nr:transketolase [Trichonephila clavata]
MAAISQANIKRCGSHFGVSIGEDGPSQMGLEDIAMFSTIPVCTVFYPSDVLSTERACDLAANKQGVCFIRTSRPNFPVIYDNDEPFAIGKAKVVKKSANDVELVIGAGVTLFEALKAADILAQQGINIRVVDIFIVNPSILASGMEKGQRTIFIGLLSNQICKEVFKVNVKFQRNTFHFL